MNDLLGNHVPIAFGVLPPALGNLQAGTLRAIAVLSPKRFSLLPDVPTANESGLPGFESVLHYGVLAPAGTPRPIIDRLNAALRALVETEQVKQRILAEGGDPMTSTPEEYAKDIDAERRSGGRWCASSISRWNEPHVYPKAQLRIDSSMRSPSGISTET
jgi:tripartite-type tricarboxylate transporter receptor subunit TctC